MNDSMRRVLNMAAQTAAPASTIPRDPDLIDPDRYFDTREYPEVGIVETDQSGNTRIQTARNNPVLVYDLGLIEEDEAPEGLIEPSSRYGYSGMLLDPDDERLNVYLDETRREA